MSAQTYRDADGRTRIKTDEATELKRYFDAHMAMTTADTVEKYARAYIDAANAEANIWALRKGIDPIASKEDRA